MSCPRNIFHRTVEECKYLGNPEIETHFSKLSKMMCSFPTVSRSEGHQVMISIETDETCLASLASMLLVISQDYSIPVSSDHSQFTSSRTKVLSYSEVDSTTSLSSPVFTQLDDQFLNLLFLLKEISARDTYLYSVMHFTNTKLPFFV